MVVAAAVELAFTEASLVLAVLATVDVVPCSVLSLPAVKVFASELVSVGAVVVAVVTVFVDLVVTS